MRDRLTDAIDLAIDFATLGEYGLEPVAMPSAGACEGAGSVSSGWEALGRARRGECRRIPVVHLDALAN